MTSATFDLPAISPEWLFAGALFLFVAALLALELTRPLRRAQTEQSGRLLANFGLGAINIATLTIVPLSGILAATIAERQNFGLLHLLALGPATAIAATLLMRSVAGYWLHRLTHRSALLWRFHRVHHGDTAFDLSTGLRHHPLEPLTMALLLGLLAALLGLSPAALLGYEIVAFFFALWTHANIALPPALDRALAWLIFTPATHAAHHSAHQPQTDSNYGDILTLWDRLFGTYTPLTPADAARLRAGLGEASDAQASRLAAQLVLPFERRPRS